MAAIIDTSRFVKIPYDRSKLAWQIVLCALLIVAGLWAALGVGPRHNAVNQFMGWFTVAVCGWLGVVFIRRALSLGTYLTLSPKGFRVGQSSTELIAWPGVTAVEERRVKLRKFLVLSLGPDAATQLLISPFARLLGQRKPSSSLIVSAQSAAVSYDELSRLVRAYFQAHCIHPGAAANPSNPSIRLAR